MENITAKLQNALEASSTHTTHNIIVTTAGEDPAGFNLKKIEGLDDLYTGRLNASEITELAQNDNVRAIDLDADNFIS